ncbi:MAG: cell division protein FtsH, partial [Candidatus Aminicenantes bacterium]
IIPRGMALGVTQQLPLGDKYSYSKNYLEAQISVLMAGRISEEIFLNTVTTGAGNDFDTATAIARQMVCEWGMSTLGPIRFGQKEDLLFLGRDMMYHNEYSEDTARRIDQEVSNIISKAYQKTKQMILDNKDKLEKIANYLLERESLSSTEIDDILKGIELKPLANSKENKKNQDEPGKNPDEPGDETNESNEKAASDRETAEPEVKKTVKI